MLPTLPSFLLSMKSKQSYRKDAAEQAAYWGGHAVAVAGFSAHASIHAFILVCIICFPCLGFNMPPEQNQLAQSIMEKIIECRFDQAQVTIDSLLASDSNDPLGLMFLMTNFSLRELDYSLEASSDSFQKAFHKVSDAIGAQEKNNIMDSYRHTIQALSTVIAAVYHLHRGERIAGLRKGLKALSLCKESKKIDSSNTDVDFILGLYDYARAELKKKFLGIIFWYSGDKFSGIKKIENSRYTACLVSLAANIALMEIYIREKTYKKASSEIDSFLSRYPGSRFAMWSKAKLYDAQKMWLKAANVYEALADLYEPIAPARKNYFTTLLLAADRYSKGSNFEKSRRECERILAVCKDGRDDHYKKANKLLRKIGSGE